MGSCNFTNSLWQSTNDLCLKGVVKYTGAKAQETQLVTSSVQDSKNILYLSVLINLSVMPKLFLLVFLA